ncbi:hypothetical protein JR316_0003864 [Psilocybe cubensis]|uniref:Uncharacterized protein n=2 Tax=Psilocybe cubensis TaxID=181762 RepID=A0ACB8H8P5_PSICU|nr:hypothetical protein JR316_0003864 [Psilocybe cubensis]KAH9484383.1 hypothetical protein JR316_0003864 [Psilocybe cubensis]
MKPLSELKGGSDEWTTCSTPTQEKVFARLYAARHHQNHRPKSTSTSSSSTNVAEPSTTPPTSVDGDAYPFGSRSNREAESMENVTKPLFPLDAHQNIIFIYPSSVNTRNVHHMPVDPAHGLVFSSTVAAQGKRHYNFYYKDSVKPLYSYRRHPITPYAISQWVSVVFSWRAPLCLRVWCGSKSKRDTCMEEMLDILFRPSTRLIWLDIDLDLNSETAEHFISSTEITEHANSVIRVRLETTKCSTGAAFKLLTRIQGLPNVKELTYGYELNDPVSLHFRRGYLYSMLLWSKLNIIDVAGELDEINCIMLLSRCVQASSITLRSLVNRDENLNVVQNRTLALDFYSLCANIPPLKLSYRRSNAHTGETSFHTELPALKTLILVPSHFDTVDVLKHFSFPTLEKLGLDIVLSANSNSLNDLHALLLRSRAPLMELNLYDMFVGPQAIVKLLIAVFVGTLSAPMLERDTELHARRWIRRTAKNFNIHFLSVLEPGKRRESIPHEAIYRRHWKEELEVALADMPFKQWCETVIPNIYITATAYGPLIMNVGWGEKRSP